MMATKKRDEFTQKIASVVAQRAMYWCSNPNCRKATIGPHSEPDKSLSDGIAAHICAAQEGDPRYDPNQTHEERKNISNAIWLCHNCSDMVDKDKAQFPKEVLIKWKHDHEEFIKNEKYIPDFPHVQLTTLPGLTFDNLNKPITHEDQKLYRQHRLVVKNEGSAAIQDIHLRVQFPEIIINSSFKDDIPAGVNIRHLPDKQGNILVSGTGRIEMTGQVIDGAMNYRFNVDKLIPRQVMKIDWLSVKNPKNIIFPSMLGSDAIFFFIEGSFQYEFKGIFHRRDFFVPLHYEDSNRIVSSLPPDDGLEWNAYTTASFPY